MILRVLVISVVRVRCCIDWFILLFFGGWLVCFWVVVGS